VYFEDKAKERSTTIASALENDEKSVAYQKWLVSGAPENGDPEQIKFLEGLNPGGPKVPKRSRCICVSDATGSMDHIWRNTKIYVGEMITRIMNIAGVGSADLMWVAYRDYCEKVVVEASNWSNDPVYLLKFIEKISPYGGGGDGEEALECGLQRAANEIVNGVTMVILIGDEPPHSQGKGGRCKWKVLETDYKLEAKRFADQGIPIHAFYMAKEPAITQSFTEIGTMTGGSATYLDPSRAQDILEVVSRNVVVDINPEFAKDYDRKYSKSYSR